MITREQYELLTRPLDGKRVGRTPQGQSHLEAWDVRRHLIRAFGFGGFDIETLSAELVREIELPPGTIKYSNGGSNNRTVWTVVYRAMVRLTIKTPGGDILCRYEDGATGDATNQPSLGDAHDLALKTALSQALKRCAVNLGDLFGLSLYDGGSTDATVRRTLAAPLAEQAAATSPAADVAAEDGPVRPDPAAAELVEVDQAAAGPGTLPGRAPSGINEDAGPSPAAVSLWNLIDGAATRDDLAELVKGVRVAADNKTITTAEADQLIAHARKRHGDLPRSTPPAAPPPADQGAAGPPPGISDGQKRRIFALFNECGYVGEQGRADRLARLSGIVGHPVESTNALLWAEARTVIAALEAQAAERQPAEVTA